ncbi:uncharacterized protein TM35_000222680 [Trypanosoma theileri]|uniref:Cation-dependent mannose-6-phosphate receptor n=1 Tax=Trypanosoma theileri TaxID=67003 RepID=A0A1X0NTF8_9TRYP|nr:uncharacterized protein TM35_000222680 [Trypanosoma theileri]ORC87469.1 hypothetical protein TM35_000222680 [Trypanosoma theileri]
MVFMSNFWTTRALVTSCIINDYDLSVIPETTLSARQEGLPFVYNWTILPCNDNKGYVTLFRPQEKPKTMTLKGFNVMFGREIQLTFSAIPTISSTMLLTLHCGNTDALKWPSEDYNISNDRTSGFDMYYATALSTALCPDALSKNRCGVGCVFVVFIFGGLAMYIVVTVIWNFFRQDKCGKSLLPHPAFWADFPFLLRDGAVYFYWKLARYFGRGYRSPTYEQVYENGDVTKNS